jgi:hypothetical protein
MSRKQQIEFKNQFLSHVSHELRTPLTCIHQYVTILRDGLAGDVSPEQRDHLNTVLRSVNQLGAMVRDLLEAARAESGKISLELRCVSIEDLIRQAVTMMRATAGQKRVGLEVGVEASIPFLHGDPDRILEILINLIDNAIKFTPADGSVTVQACRLPTDPDFVCVSVIDTGKGIAPEARSLVFERLYQDPAAVDNSRKGLGLGLFIAKELVTLHGGRIWVVSDGASGSIFSFTLPLYSLPKLLQPVITCEGQLRSAIVLVRLDLQPKTRPPHGNWKDVCNKTRALLERCVYVDKDLVLPAMSMPAPEQSLFVVASTNLERSAIMLKRIREQLQKMEELNKNGTFELSAVEVPLPDNTDGLSSYLQVQEVAERITTMVKDALITLPAFNPQFLSN